MKKTSKRGSDVKSQPRRQTVQFSASLVDEFDPTSGCEKPARKSATQLSIRRKSHVPSDIVESLSKQRGNPALAFTAIVLIGVGLKVDWDSFFDFNRDGVLSSGEADALGRVAGIACVLVLLLGWQVFIYQAWENARYAQKTMSPFHQALKGKQSDEHHIDYLQQEYSNLQAQLTRKKRSSSVPVHVAAQDPESIAISRRTKKSQTVKTVQDFVRTGAKVDMTALLADHRQARLNELAKDIHKWDFNFFDVAEITKEPLAFTGFICLDALLPSLPTEFVVDKAKLLNFLTDVERAYRDVPYHNSLHGANVAHLVWSFCEACGLRAHLPSEMQFTLVLAGLVHDIHHPGITASFLEKAGSRWKTDVVFPFELADMELSILYNDQSPLENMHCAQAFHLLSKQQNAFLPSSTTAGIRRALVRAILGTDMAKHAETMTKLGALIEHKERNGKSHIPWWWPSSPPASTDPEKRTAWERSLEEEFVMELFLHAADVGTPSLPIDQWRRWNSMIQAEFHNQGDLERREFGVLISPPAGFDRGAGAKAQHIFTKGFMQYVSLPLFTQIDILTRFPDSAFVASGVDISCCLENLRDNIQIWEETVPDDA